MAPLEQLLDAERKALELIGHSGLPEPDEVEYGETCIRLFWQESKLVLIIDLESEEGSEAVAES